MRFQSSWLLPIALGHCACASSNKEIEQPVIETNSIAIAALTSASTKPSNGKDPLSIERLCEASQCSPAPWLEAPSTPMGKWVFSPASYGVSRAVNPILGDLHIALLESTFAIVDTAVGQLIRTDRGMVGLVPKGHRVIGALTDGTVLSEDTNFAPSLSNSIQDFIEGRRNPITDVSRVFDASGTWVIALKEGGLVRSNDSGKTYKSLNIKDPIEKALIRDDGVAVVRLAGKAPKDAWQVIDPRGAAKSIAVPADKLIRWRTWIMEPPGRTPYNHPAPTNVLTKPGTKLEQNTLDGRVQAAEFTSMGPFPTTPKLTTQSEPWQNALTTPPKPEKPMRFPRIAAPTSNVRGRNLVPPEEMVSRLGVLSTAPSEGEVGGVVAFGMVRTDTSPPPPCVGLACIASKAPILHQGPSANLVAWFFDDAYCNPSTNKKTCEPGAPIKPPTIGFYDRQTREFRLIKTPPSCEPGGLFSIRGLVILECVGRRFVADKNAMWVDEGPFAELSPPPDKKDSSAFKLSEYKVADDGTIARCQGTSGNYFGVYVRAPAPPKDATTWQSASVTNAVLCEPLPGGAVVIGKASKDNLSLTLDIIENGKTENIASNVQMPGQVLRVLIENSHFLIEFAEDVKVPNAEAAGTNLRVTTRRALITNDGELIAR